MVDAGEPVDIIYLDFSKAFDRVPLRRLLFKLRHLGIAGNVLLWIEAFLTGREFSVRVGNDFSTSRPVCSGVPQGSVLGPLLFLLYVSDLPFMLKSNVVAYADDMKIYNCSLKNPWFYRLI